MLLSPPLQLVAGIILAFFIVKPDYKGQERFEGVTGVKSGEVPLPTITCFSSGSFTLHSLYLYASDMLIAPCSHTSTQISQSVHSSAFTTACCSLPCGAVLESSSTKLIHSTGHSSTHMLVPFSFLPLQPSHFSKSTTAGISFSSLFFTYLLFFVIYKNCYFFLLLNN